MDKSVDQIAPDSPNTPLPRVLFVTDPLCSWCFGTLPEVLAVRAKLQDIVQFDIVMGGLQIGTSEGLLGYDVKRLRKLWHEVATTTGQTFSGVIPEGFVYHSELSCRAVEVARARAGGEPPFEFFERLQTAFYHQGKDINSVKVLAPLLDVDESELQLQLHSAAIIDQTRRGFELVRSLSANALPHFLIDVGAGYQLLCGGYITEAFLIPDIEHRINAAKHDD